MRTNKSKQPAKKTKQPAKKINGKDISTIAIWAEDKEVLDGRERTASVTNAELFHQLLIEAGWIKK